MCAMIDTPLNMKKTSFGEIRSRSPDLEQKFKLHSSAQRRRAEKRKQSKMFSREIMRIRATSREERV